jgi:D-apionolactonase
MADAPRTVAPTVALYGTLQEAPASRTLRAGALSAELEDGALRAVRWHGVEILRGAAYLVRDTGWGTPPARLSGLSIEEDGDGFRVSYDALVEMGKQRYACRALIRGTAAGRLDFEARGTAITDVRTCRTGFVILHPLDGVAGGPVEIVHADGTRETSRFPRQISPGQPFLSIRSIGHEPAPGIRATCTLEGDVFEMEDQRNWTDASFKTYVRPLSLPTPYTIPAGTTIDQAIRLEVAGMPHAARASAEGARVAVGRVTIGRAGASAMPPVGIGIDTRRLRESLALAKFAREAGVALLAGRFDPLADGPPTDGEDLLRGLAELASATGAGLLLEIPLPCRRDPDTELGDVARRVEEAELPLAGVTPAPAAYLKSYQPSGPWPDTPPFPELYRAARRAFPGVPVGGGVHAFFTELNRARPPVDECDYVAFTTSPIVHAADERSIRESLQALPFVMETARSFCKDRPLRVGPSAIGMRDNPYGKAPVENPRNERVAMARMDPRQRGLFGAGWYLGHAAALVHGGAASVCLGALAGEFGFAYHRTDYPQPWFDEDTEARVYPAWHVLRALARAAGSPLLEVTVEGGHDVSALGWMTSGGPELWLANGSNMPLHLNLAGLGPTASARVLDAAGFAAACRDPGWFDRPERAGPVSGGLELGPCALARITP